MTARLHVLDNRGLTRLNQDDQDKVGKQGGEVYHVTARLHALDNRGLTRLNQEDQGKVGKQRGEVYHVTARLHALDKQRAYKAKPGGSGQSRDTAR